MAVEGCPLEIGDFSFQGAPVEVRRLVSDGLVDGEVAFTKDGACLVCRVDSVTPEGTEFHKLIENDDVWVVIFNTMKAADIDVSYPLLKEVCEEIVKRYVTSFIPDRVR